MKALHKISNPKHANPRFGFIQVKNNFVYATNDNAAVRLPVLEVFPKDLILEGEEVYFSSEEWAKAKMHEAQTMSREGLLFTAYKRGKATGHVKALSPEQFVKAYSSYPDIEGVLPPEDAEPSPVSHIWMTGKHLSAIHEALDYTNAVPTLTFVSSGRNARVTFNKGHKGIGVLAIIDRNAPEAEVLTAPAEQKKTVSTVTRTTSTQSDITKARFDIEAELKLLYALLPDLDEEGQKKFDQKSGSIDDCLDIIRDAEDDLDEERKDLKKGLSDAEDRIKELEDEAQADIDPEDLDDAILLQVFGSDPIVCIPQNTLDKQFIEVLGNLTNKIQPIRLMGLLKLLDNPRVAVQLEEIHELDAMLY